MKVASMPRRSSAALADSDQSRNSELHRERGDRYFKALITVVFDTRQTAAMSRNVRPSARSS
jgi:hypothetical protein